LTLQILFSRKGCKRCLGQSRGRFFIRSRDPIFTSATGENIWSNAWRFCDMVSGWDISFWGSVCSLTGIVFDRESRNLRWNSKAYRIQSAFHLTTTSGQTEHIMCAVVVGNCRVYKSVRLLELFVVRILSIDEIQFLAKPACLVTDTSQIHDSYQMGKTRFSFAWLFLCY
jgi:hypothetical protein